MFDKVPSELHLRGGHLKCLTLRIFGQLVIARVGARQLISHIDEALLRDVDVIVAALKPHVDSHRVIALIVHGGGELVRQTVIDEVVVADSFPVKHDFELLDGEVNGARYFCCIIIARIVGQSDDCGIIARGDRIRLLSVLGEGDISGHVAFLQRRDRPRQSHLVRLVRSVIGKIGIDRQPALQYHLRNGELFHIDHAVKLVIARVVAFQFGGGGILAGVDRLSVRDFSRHGNSSGHAVAFKHALGLKLGHGGVAAVLQFVKTAPSSCGEGERGDRIGKEVVLITYGVSAFALYGHGVNARVKSVHAEHRLVVLIRNGNGEVVGRKRAALSSAFNEEVFRGDELVRVFDGVAVNDGCGSRIRGLDHHGNGGCRFCNGLGLVSYLIVTRFHVPPKHHGRSERYLLAHGKDMTRVKAARPDHYGILRGVRYAGRVKFGHPRGQIERRHIRSVFGHSRTHGYFARGFPLDGHGKGSNGEVLTHAARDVGVACRNGGGVSVRVRARVVRQVEPLDGQSHAVHGHGSQRYALLCRIVGQVAFLPSHFRAADVKLVHGDGHSVILKLIVSARRVHIQRVAARGNIGLAAKFHRRRHSCPCSTERKRIAFNGALYQAVFRICHILIQIRQIIVQEGRRERRSGESLLFKSYVKLRRARQIIFVRKRSCNGNGDASAIAYISNGLNGKFKYAVISFL